MRLPQLLVFLFIVCIGCQDENPVVTLDGIYLGTFYRSMNGVPGETSNVTLTFQNGHYDGASSIVKYPALCKGNYSVEGDVASFTNSCMWTAEFDWTLILNGDYKVSAHGDSEIALLKRYPNGQADHYQLTRQ